MNIAVLAGMVSLSLANVTGQQIKPAGYLAEPKTVSGAGVLVLHPWWGLNGDVKAFCDRLAKSGFIAFAPDLFNGKVVSTRDEAQALVDKYQSKEAELNKKILDAAMYLETKTTKKEIAVVGFSFGAYYALSLSSAEPSRVKSVVVYYGTGAQDFGKSTASYLGHFAEKDEYEPKENVDALTKLLTEAKRPVKTYVYPGTGHWFAEPSVAGAYNKAASEQAWDRTVQFLRVTLGIN